MAQSRPFRIGTRGSPLALWQAHAVRDLLRTRHDLDEECLEIVDVRTTGDVVLDRRLADLGGKGLFTKELDLALEDGTIDCAVHSLKDVPTFLPYGVELVAYLEREDPRDALIAPGAGSLMDLKAGAVLGTASLRREALVRHARPDLSVTLLRGNIGTRLKRVADGELDATLLAHAGLKRLGRTDAVACVLEPDVFLPAVGQGIVAIAIRSGDSGAAALLRPLNVKASELAARTERAFLGRLNGSCRSPIGGHAAIEGDRIILDGRLMTLDGTEFEATRQTGSASAPEDIGTAAADAILAASSAILLDALRD